MTLSCILKVNLGNFRFIDLVRSKTPKVTMYTEKAKCMLMENSQPADFEATFYEGESHYYCK